VRVRIAALAERRPFRMDARIRWDDALVGATITEPEEFNQLSKKIKAIMYTTDYEPNNILISLVISSCVVGLLPSSSSTAQTISADEYMQRRSEIMSRLPDGILLLHARSAPKEMDQPGWIQDANFFYFTGLGNLPGAILALDGPKAQAHLFLPSVPQPFGIPVPDLIPEADQASAQVYGMFDVRPGSEFTSYVESRIDENVRKLYVDTPRRPEVVGVPDGMLAVSGTGTLWRQSLAHQFPDAQITSVENHLVEMRWAKSPTEVEILRQNAVATGKAMLAGVRSIRPGVSQRRAELAVVSGCYEAGAEGPSFWPWMMSGPNSNLEQVVRSVYDYEHLNRTMQSGELVRVDVGCTGGFYGGDVGRTAPVSGTFTDEQAEIWNLLVAGYLAGLKAIKAGININEVFDASKAEIRRKAGTIKSEKAKAAAEQMPENTFWHIHGVGIESAEAPMDTLRSGTVIAYEPMFPFGGTTYYLEDMILVTPEGHEVLSSDLPYTAEEIGHFMKGGNKQ
jgi:Xaa-Pro aminopeptidase